MAAKKTAKKTTKKAPARKAGKPPAEPIEEFEEEFEEGFEMEDELEGHEMDDTAQGSIEVNTVAPPPLKEPAEGVTGISEDVNLGMIMDIPVDVHVEIGRTSLPVREFLKLGVGSVLQLDRLVGESADLIINGKLIGRGDVVVVDETFGIRITELVGEKELLSSW